jgi:hypothetical protein
MILENRKQGSAVGFSGGFRCPAAAFIKSSASALFHFTRGAAQMTDA